MSLNGGGQTSDSVWHRQEGDGPNTAHVAAPAGVVPIGHRITTSPVASEDADKPCQTASCLLNSAAMQQFLAKATGWLRHAMTGLVAVWLLGLGLLAASGNVHQALHADAATAHAPCAVCLLAQGQLEAVGSELPILLTTAPLGWSLSPYQAVTPQGFDYSVAFSRGPPTSIPSQSVR